MTMENRVVKVDALPTSLEEVRGLAEAFVKSGMFSDTKQLAQAIVKIQAGRELGLPPVYSMQNINLIRDRLTTSANTMAMLVKRSGKYNYRVKEHTDLACSITFFEDSKEVGVSTFTIEDAKRANLMKPDSGWVKFPRAMLFSRAISQGARMYAPDAIGGIYTDEEIRSIPPRPKEEVEPEPEPILSPDNLSGNKKPVEEQVSGNLPEEELNPTELAGFIDKNWLTENIKKLQEKKPKVWSEPNVLSFLKNMYRVEGKDIVEAVSKLDKGMAKNFTKRIQEGLEKESV